jgi:hypothetical protein
LVATTVVPELRLINLFFRPSHSIEAAAFIFSLIVPIVIVVIVVPTRPTASFCGCCRCSVIGVRLAGGTVASQRDVGRLSLHALGLLSAVTIVLTLY